MKSTARIASLAFLGGLLVGGLAGRFLSPWNPLGSGGRRGPDHRLIHEMDRRLKLTPDQHVAISAILVESRKKMHALGDEVRPRFEELRNATAAEVRAQLTGDQQIEFDKMRKEFEERERKRGDHWRHGGPDGPPPPAS